METLPMARPIEAVWKKRDETANRWLRSFEIQLTRFWNLYLAGVLYITLLSLTSRLAHVVTHIHSRRIHTTPRRPPGRASIFGYLGTGKDFSVLCFCIGHTYACLRGMCLVRIHRERRGVGWVKGSHPDGYWDGAGGNVKETRGQPAGPQPRWG